MHQDNIFLTLTYDDEHLPSNKLFYPDWQEFAKKLREKRVNHITDPEVKKEYRKKFYMPMMVTGEYGEQNKRPHWHAIIFNYRPKDSKHLYTSDHGEEVFTSDEIHKLWGKGRHEFGSVTIESAGYVARYASKKLVHGHDGDHEYEPIHRTASKRGIGRTWIEKYWKHTFDNGFIVLPNGQKAGIPRYYVDWLKTEKPDVWEEYVTGVKLEQIEKAEAKARKEELEYLSRAFQVIPNGQPRPKTRNEVRETILKSKFKRLTENLKL